MDPLDRLSSVLADRYGLEREVGQGGMATVYLAEDLKHGRKVAIKVLRPELAAVIGAERFVREIRTIANLQHAHILGLIDSGEVNGTAYYVMPFVEGESLRDRLIREKQLPIADAVRLAQEVASALDYAHRHGVIHRDVKPENVLLHEGQALVADFGIALAVASAGGSRMTETGMSLGTPHYMSPEQAMGERDITGRSDVYALGVLTYEMLLGEPPFTGPTAQAIVAKVLTEKPGSLVLRRSRIPGHVEEAVLTALEKLPADRFATAAEFAAALGGQSGPRRATGFPPAPALVSRSRQTAVLVGVLLVTAALALWGWLRPGAVGPALRFGRAVQVTSDPGLEIQPALSPDGRSVAYAAGTSAGTRIYVRQVAGGRATPLTDDSTGFQQSPQWSPDGSRILFLIGDAVFSVPAAGGSARQEVPRGHRSVVSAAWSPDGRSIAFVIGDSVYVRDVSGSVRPVARVVSGGRCSWSPDGTLLACSSGNPWYLEAGSSLGNISPTRIMILRVGDGAVVTVTDSTSVNESPAWSADGRWLYYVSTRDGIGDIYGQRISRGHAAGEPIRLTTGLGAQSISLSRDASRLAYAVYTARANIWSLPLPAAGPVSADRMTPVTTGNQVVENMRVSHDGRWLLYDSNRYGNADIFRVPTSGGETEQLTSDPADEFSPDLSPDGRELAYHSWRSGSRDIYVQPLDGRPLQTVTATPDQEFNPVWDPSGSALEFGRGFGTRAALIVRRAPDGHWGSPVERVSNDCYGVDWSPDGRYLAYMTRNDGGSLMVVPVDSGAPRVIVDARIPGNPDAEDPYWSRDGRSIVFKSHDPRGLASIWSVPAAGGRPRMLIHFDDPTHPSYRPQWALGRDRVYFPVQDRQSDVWVMDIAAARARSR